MGWSFLRTWAHKYGFTEAEARAVALIASAAIVGALLGGTPASREVPSYTEEYRLVDSIFDARSSDIDLVGSDSTDNVHVAAAVQPTPAKGLVDINTASARDLEALPGIGPVIAGRIVDFRTKYGKFRALDDLIKVKSIGKKKFHRIEPYICICE